MAELNKKEINLGLKKILNVDFKFLREVVNEKTESSLKSNIIPSIGAVYVFWWTGNIELNKQQKFNKNFTLYGPKNKPYTIIFNNEWLHKQKNGCVALYIGKCANNLNKRIGQHLRLSEKKWLDINPKLKERGRTTTASQLRDRMELLFEDESNVRTLILDNIGLSYYELSESKNAINRFYLEDLAIGSFYPILNIDIER